MAAIVPVTLAVTTSPVVTVQFAVIVTVHPLDNIAKAVVHFGLCHHAVAISIKLLERINHPLAGQLKIDRLEFTQRDVAVAGRIGTFDQIRAVVTVMADGLVAYAQDGRDAENMQPLDLDDLFRKLCQDRGVQYYGAAGIQVMGRRVGLGRAIGNLIDNAVRYGADTTVTLSQTKQYAVITVEDTGPGIPPDRLEDMFQPFTRGENSRSGTTGGVGLGLSIARTIILAHGGRITLENRMEDGLRAAVRLKMIS